jgi:alcohol dehydrogenase (cytochrome c)
MWIEHGRGDNVHAGPGVRRCVGWPRGRRAWHRSFRRVQAWNVDTGRRVWTHTYAKSPNWGSMLATSGGLVFTGGTSDRRFHAFDAATGKLLWDFPTNSGILAPPTSFAIGGTQYIAVETGWGGDARGMQATLNRLFPGDYPEVPEGGAVWVFTLN